MTSFIEIIKARLILATFAFEQLKMIIDLEVDKSLENC